MNEFFRKHGKWILAILGVVLMVLWVLPDQSGRSRGGSAQEVGRLAGKKVTDADIGKAANHLQHLQSVIAPQFLPPINQDEPGLHYFLLLEDARKLGVLVSDGEVEQLVADVAPAFARANLTPGQQRALMKEFLLLRKAQALSSQIVQMSLPELEHMLADTQSQLSLAYAALKTDAVPASVPNPLSDAVKKQFDTYKDVLPETAGTNPPERNGHRYPFAYKYPDRVKFEYIRIPYDLVREKSKPRTPAEIVADEEAAFQYYQEHPDLFRTPASTQASTQAGSQPATRAEEVTKFETVRDRLLNEQIDKRARTKVKEISERAQAMLLVPWNGAGKDEKGYFKELPRKDWVDYDKIKAEIAKIYQVEVEPRGESGWLSRMELANYAGIGKAAFVKPNRAPLPFAQLALNVRELVTNQTGVYLQVGAEGPVLVDEAHNAYVYRVTAAEAAHEPKDVEEVRDRVIYDLRRLAYFEARKGEGEALAAEAGRIGIKAAAAKAGAPFEISPPFPRRRLAPKVEKGQVVGTLYETSPIPMNGEAPPIVAPQLVEQAFELAIKIGPVQHAASQPATAPGSTQPAATQSGDVAKAKAAFAVPVETHLTVYVASVDSHMPLSEDMFGFLRGYYSQQHQQINTALFQQQWSSLKAVAQRLNYVPARGKLSERE